MASAILVCNVCYEPYDVGAIMPMTLECGHTFCKRCLTGIVEHRGHTQTACPTCRVPLARPMAELRPNYDIMQAVAAEGSRGTSCSSNTTVEELLKQSKTGHAGHMILDSQNLCLEYRLSNASGGKVEAWQGKFRPSQSRKNEAVVCKIFPANSHTCLELLILMRLTQDCTHVCRYHGITLKDGRLCLVMPLYPCSLASHIEDQAGGRLDLYSALLIGQDIARGLAELHALGVTAESLHPNNVLLTRRGTAMLTDFGVRRALATSAIQRELTEHEGKGMMVADAPTDIWAFACTLIHMLTGHRSPMHNRPSLPPGLPQDLHHLLTCCLDMDPSLRPTAWEVAEALLSMIDTQAKNSVVESTQLGHVKRHSSMHSALGYSSNCNSSSSSNNSNSSSDTWAEAVAAVSSWERRESLSKRECEHASSSSTMCFQQQWLGQKQ